MRILRRRHVQTSFWKPTPSHGRSFERLEKAIVLLFLSASDPSTRDSIVLSRSTGTRPRAAVNFYLSVRPCHSFAFSISDKTARMEMNIFRSYDYEDFSIQGITRPRCRRPFFVGNSKMPRCSPSVMKVNREVVNHWRVNLVTEVWSSEMENRGFRRERERRFCRIIYVEVCKNELQKIISNEFFNNAVIRFLNLVESCKITNNASFKVDIYTWQQTFSVTLWYSKSIKKLGKYPFRVIVDRYTSLYLRKQISRISELVDPRCSGDLLLQGKKMP